MFCKNCGHELLSNATFCGYCGAKVELKTLQANQNAPQQQSTQQMPQLQSGYQASQEQGGYYSRQGSQDGSQGGYQAQAQFKPQAQQMHSQQQTFYQPAQPIKRARIPKKILAATIAFVIAIAGVAVANETGVINIPIFGNSPVWVVKECKIYGDSSYFGLDYTVTNPYIDAKLNYDNAGNCTSANVSGGWIDRLGSLSSSYYGINLSSIDMQLKYDKDGAPVSGNIGMAGMSVDFNVANTKNAKGCITSQKLDLSNSGLSNLLGSYSSSKLDTLTSTINYEYENDGCTLKSISYPEEKTSVSISKTNSGLLLTGYYSQSPIVEYSVNHSFGSDNKAKSIVVTARWDSSTTNTQTYTTPVECDSNGNINKIQLDNGVYITLDYQYIANPSANVKATCDITNSVLCPRK